MTDSYDYDAFGNKLASTGSTPNEFLYRGEQYDPDLGMYYLRARYYNPLTGRFLGVDSEAGQGQRRYEYAGADPVNGLDPSGDEAIIEFALLTFYPGRLPVHFPGFPSWCGFEMDGFLPGCGGSDGGGGQNGNGAGPGAPGGPPSPPPCKGNKCSGKLGIGIEVPAASAVKDNVLNVAKDTGHTFVYLKDASSSFDSILSFGPSEPIGAANGKQFLNNNLPGNAHWPIENRPSTWEFKITGSQLTAGEQAISNFKANVPNYTPYFQCTTGALSIARDIGLTLPSGVGPVIAREYGHTFFSGNVANPYHLNQQMTTAYGRGNVVSASIFPNALN